MKTFIVLLLSALYVVGADCPTFLVDKAITNADVNLRNQAKIATLGGLRAYVMAGIVGSPLLKLYDDYGHESAILLTNLTPASVSAGFAWALATNALIIVAANGGTTNAVVYEYTLGAQSPLPTTATFLTKTNFGNGLSRDVVIQRLASGGIVAFTSQHTNLIQFGVIYRSPGGVYTVQSSNC